MDELIKRQEAVCKSLADDIIYNIEEDLRMHGVDMLQEIAHMCMSGGQINSVDAMNCVFGEYVVRRAKLFGEANSFLMELRICSEREALSNLEQDSTSEQS